MQDFKTTPNTPLEQVQIDKESFYKISNVDDMRPFFMSIVSDSNHWMFIGSNGGLSAGRKNADNAFFPYYTDDKIIESVENTGSKSIFHVQKGDKSHIWEPFSIRNTGLYKISRNLYKSVHGNKILFEEVNQDLDLTFQYQWNSSNQYGFVRKSRLINRDSNEVNITILDGLQNIVPCGVGSSLQNLSSNLVDAYKRNERVNGSSIGIFALSAIIVDKAEPSEALKANIAWSYGLENVKYLLSSLQLDNYRKALPIEGEHDVKAERGAYFISSEITLSGKSERDWMIIANVNQSMTDIANLKNDINNDSLIHEKIAEDIEAGTRRLIALTAGADGLQLTQDQFRDTRHFSNSLFNIMRGGIFDDNYQIDREDFINYLMKANSEVFESSKKTIQNLPDTFALSNIKELAQKSADSNFKRLCLEYLPLKFSRRHGDPSRPWNKFSINTNSEIDGSKILDYEGNWRDIFQNWEALAHSYPEFIEGMIYKFLNASTFDGYNPYRITKSGIDWEKDDPDDPWSYIGYWGDHQIIYLLKFLEFAEDHSPGKLESYFGKDIFVYGNVPYQIKSYENILKNPKDTIVFNEDLDHKINNECESLGADGTLIKDKQGAILQVNFIEKILATVLAKMSNFIPEGGIWMNTQRPEWNDANNALVGNGVSMVTLYYLRRFLTFFNRLLQKSTIKEVHISEELLSFFKSISETLLSYQGLLSGSINDKDRKLILDGLGLAGSQYRLRIYEHSFEKKKAVSLEEIGQFIDISLKYLEHSIDANKRTDNLFHAYNLMTIKGDGISISNLNEMLEGQVAVLSSEYLSSKESLEVLDSLKRSSLFREDQYSYLLYPNKDLPGFAEKNNISKSDISNSALLSTLIADGNSRIIESDVNEDYHFNGNFKNSNDLQNALDQLKESKYEHLINSNKEQVLQIFEDVFNHKAFTGRSGTFFGYEGLGSIYWHMVSKLQLAVQECCIRAVEDQVGEEIIGRLLEHYYEINEGIGVHKSPALYGAFPTDPYSHTPAGKGAQQPGMTGQVKEDILCRFAELGVFVKDGKLCFKPYMLRTSEFLLEPGVFKYVNVQSQAKQINVEAGSLCFTYCQLPIVYKFASEEKLEVIRKDGTRSSHDNLSLDTSTSHHVFERSNEVVQINVHLKEASLK